MVNRNDTPALTTLMHYNPLIYPSFSLFNYPLKIQLIALLSPKVSIEILQVR